MKRSALAHRLVATPLVASLALASLAPAANAGHANGGPWKFRRDECGPRVVQASECREGPRVVEIHRSSCGGSTIAGFIGGLAVGVILSSAQQAAAHQPARCPEPAYSPPPSDYDESDYGPASDEYCYEDPWCHERFASLDLYLAHSRHCGHPRVARVIDVQDDDCVGTIHYSRGHWEDEDGVDWHD